jgi:hypothetical protein
MAQIGAELKHWLIGVIIVSTMPPSGMMQPEATVDQICTPGYSRVARPPTNYTNPIKEDSCAVLDSKPEAVRDCMKTHELDHYFPIEAGGCTDCPDNLWLQDWPHAKQKDQVENYVHSLLCTHKIGLEDVPDYMTNWEEIYEQIKAE